MYSNHSSTPLGESWDLEGVQRNRMLLEMCLPLVHLYNTVANTPRGSSRERESRVVFRTIARTFLFLLQLTEVERGMNQMDYRAYGAPLEERKRCEVDIKELSRRGDGVARIGGFVIFVPNTRLGDHVTIEIL